MSELFIELAGEEFASDYPFIHVTGCRVKKENMTMQVDIESDVFLSSMPLDAFKEKIVQKFGVTDVQFLFTYRNFTLCAENFPAFFEIFLEQLCAELPSLTNILTGSTAKLKQNTMHIFLRFGGEQTLQKQNIDKKAEELISRIFNVQLSVVFEGVQNNEADIFKKLEEERNKMIEGSSERAMKTEEKKVTKTVVKVKDEKEKDENILIGKDFAGKITPMGEINEYSGKVIVSGKIIGTDVKEIRNEKVIFFIFITDGTGSVTCKTFLKNEEYKELKGKLKSTKAVCIRGLAQYDSFEREVTIKLDDMKVVKVS